MLVVMCVGVSTVREALKITEQSCVSVCVYVWCAHVCVCVCLCVCVPITRVYSPTVDCIVRQSEVVADSETVELCSADVPDGTPTGACVVFIVDESLSMKNEHQWLIGFSQLLEEELNNAGDTIDPPHINPSLITIHSTVDTFI